MGFWGDQVVLGQKPRKNGCICTVLAVLGVIATSGYWITEVIA